MKGKRRKSRVQGKGYMWQSMGPNVVFSLIPSSLRFYFGVWRHHVSLLYGLGSVLAAGNQILSIVVFPKAGSTRMCGFVLSVYVGVPMIPELTMGLASSPFCPVTALHYT